MNIVVIIWKIFQSKRHDMDKHTRGSWQELLDYRFYYERLGILLLHPVSSVATRYISMTRYKTVANIRLKLLRKITLEFFLLDY